MELKLRIDCSMCIGSYGSTMNYNSEQNIHGKLLSCTSESMLHGVVGRAPAAVRARRPRHAPPLRR